MTWCGRIALAAVLPLLLAAVAVQELAGLRGVAAAPGLGRVLVWGPLLETVLLLTAAWLVDRAMGPAGLRRRADAVATGRFVACTAIVGFSFWAAHAVQNGSPAWATLPMALLMAAYAARHAGNSPGKLCKLAGPMLFTMHAVYNACILVFAADWNGACATAAGHCLARTATGWAPRAGAAGLGCAHASDKNSAARQPPCSTAICRAHPTCSVQRS